VSTRGPKPAPGGEVANTPQPPSGTVVAMKAPADLSDDAKKVWDLAVSDLIALRVFRPSDALMLQEFCELLAQAQKFRRSLQDEPDMGSQEAKRLRTGWLQSFKAAASISAEFGMSPVARIRLGLMKAQGGTLLGKLNAQSGEAGP
jgi:P27 family predicted phage terminase small subunit